MTIYNYLKEIAVCVCIALLNRNGNSIGNFLNLHMVFHDGCIIYNLNSICYLLSF